MTKNPRPHVNRAHDLTGLQFGRLTVLRRGADKVYSRSKASVWVCQCECGTIKEVRGNGLARGQTLSCGCFHDSLISERGVKTRISPTHGLSRTAAYSSWLRMIARCTDPKNRDWKDYGGRGITVCPRWHDIEAFVQDMGQPADGESIDRIDNDKGYEPGNCRWADMKTQSRNRRSNVLREYAGKMRCMAEIAEMNGLRQEDIWRRVVQLEMPVDLAIAYAKWQRERRKKTDKIRSGRKGRL